MEILIGKDLVVTSYLIPTFNTTTYGIRITKTYLRLCSIGATY